MKRLSQTARDYVTMVLMAVAICGSFFAYSYAFGSMPGPQGGGSSGVSLSGTNTWTGAQTFHPSTNVVPVVARIASGGSSNALEIRRASDNALQTSLTDAGEIFTGYVYTTTVAQFNSAFKFDTGKVAMNAACLVSWGPVNYYDAQDTALARGAVGFVEVNGGTAGAKGGIKYNGYTTTEKLAIAPPTEGMVIYDKTLHKLCVYTGSAWETITSL